MKTVAPLRLIATAYRDRDHDHDHDQWLHPAREGQKRAREGGPASSRGDQCGGGERDVGSVLKPEHSAAEPRDRKRPVERGQHEPAIELVAEGPKQEHDGSQIPEYRRELGGDILGFAVLEKRHRPTNRMPRAEPERHRQWRIVHAIFAPSVRCSPRFFLTAKLGEELTLRNGLGCTVDLTQAVGARLPGPGFPVLGVEGAG